MRNLNAEVNNQLTQIKSQGLWRQRQIWIDRQLPYYHILESAHVTSTDSICFMDNDYLGLSQHPKVIHAAQEALQKWGISTCSSPLLSGYSALHQKLEIELADFLGFEKALVFSSGYLANMSVIQALVAKDDIIFADRLSHASLIDGIQLSRAKFFRYPHQDAKFIQNKIAEYPLQRSWIVTDGVFSMDGTQAPLPQLVQLGQNHDAGLIIDDAHGIGVLGQKGRGIIEAQKIMPAQITALTGTFAKAFGGIGAFVAGRKHIIETLIQSGRGYIFNTALSPIHVASALTALEIIKKEQWRREHLQSLVDYIQKRSAQLGIAFLPSSTPIQIYPVGRENHVMDLASHLKKFGFLVGAIRPPTVPKNTARLRISLNVSHQISHIEKLLQCIARYPS